MVRMTTIGIVLILVTNFSLAGDLHKAIAKHESGNNPKKYNKKERAAGHLQIRPCVVSDCNRIVGHQKWTLADRYNPSKAREMFNIYLNYYGEQYSQTTGRKPTSEVLARIWNGGPNGWRKPSTRKYWRDVRAFL